MIMIQLSGYLWWSHEEFLNVEIIQQQSAAHSMNSHADMRLTVRDLQQLLNVLVSQKPFNQWIQSYINNRLAHNKRSDSPLNQTQRQRRHQCSRWSHRPSQNCNQTDNVMRKSALKPSSSKWNPEKYLEKGLLFLLDPSTVVPAGPSWAFSRSQLAGGSLRSVFSCSNA